MPGWWAVLFAPLDLVWRNLAEGAPSVPPGRVLKSLLTSLTLLPRATMLFTVLIALMRPPRGVWVLDSVCFQFGVWVLDSV